MKAIKYLMHSLCDEFSYSKIMIADLSKYSTPRHMCVAEVTMNDVRSSAFPDIAKCAGDEAAAAKIYGLWESELLVGRIACFPGDTYTDVALPNRLRPDDVLVNRLVVAPEMRKRGMGSTLLKVVFSRLAEIGYCRAYAVVWHNNWASIRAFKKAGAKFNHRVIMLDLKFRTRPFYIHIPF